MSPRICMARLLPALLVGLPLGSSWAANPTAVEPALPLLAQLSPATEGSGQAVVANPATPAVPSQIAPEAAPGTPMVEPPSLVVPAAANAPTSAAAPKPSESITVNLIERLVQRGVLTKEDSAELMQMAEQDAAQAKAEMQAQQQIITQTAVAQALAEAEASGRLGGGGGAVSGPEPLELEDDAAVRVTYIPESVKQQLRDELRADVMQQARDERWAAPRLLPEWATRIRLFGDIRARYEGDYFPEGNDNTGAFPNFNAINTGNPFDTAGTVFSPQLNVDEDRHRARLRARIGLEADLGTGFTAGVRIATGDSNSPVTANQSLGLANQGQGGQFSKYALWLDRAYLRYDTGDPNHHLNFMVGRFDNPFFSSEILWDDDLGFDGAAMQARYQVTPWLTPWATAGAFVIFNTDLNFSTNRPDKFRSTDKYLYAGQIGFDLKPHKDINFKFGAGYYYFDNVAGRLSDPFIPLNAQDQGNTDDTRPSFAQKGNTYRPLRNIVASPLNNFGTTNQFQYFGLATPFQELSLTARLDWLRWDPFQISLSGEYIQNLAYDEGRLRTFGVNNRGPNDTGIGAFEGGDMGYMVSLRAGKLALAKPWDWVVGANYRYLESDAQIDGFTDSDFGLGGTNMKGWTVFGGIALSPNISLFLRYMTADEIAGPQFKTDIFQVDLSGRF